MRTCFFIPSDILFAEQVSIERNNSVVVIFRHLLPLLPNLYFISCLSLIFLYVMFSLLFYVMFGLIFFTVTLGLFFYVMFGLDPNIHGSPGRTALARG